MLHSLILGFSLLSTVLAQSDSSLITNVTQAFSKARVVPDVLPSFAPTALASIVFPGSANQPVNVTPGALLTQPQTAIEPTFSIVANNSSLIANQTFVLALVDPDAPTPQNTSLSQFLHFLGADFGVNTTSSNPTLLTNRTAALMEFFPPTPPAGSPPHRYVLVVYTQPTDFDDNAPSFVNASTPRPNFNLTQFASSVGLRNPVAGNFFFVGPDNSTTTDSAGPSATPPPTGSGASTPGSATSGITTMTTGAGGTSGAFADVHALVGVTGCVYLVILALFIELWGF